VNHEPTGMFPPMYPVVLLYRSPGSVSNT